MEDWLKCQITPALKYHRNKQKTNKAVEFYLQMFNLLLCKKDFVLYMISNFIYTTTISIMKKTFF